MLFSFIMSEMVKDREEPEIVSLYILLFLIKCEWAHSITKRQLTMGIYSNNVSENKKNIEISNIKSSKLKISHNWKINSLIKEYKFGEL